ncbi:MAG: MMPL family transporter [Actinomycetia bacterium]|nr:MMPL family transporter [Actinomycetes bacterium]MCP4957951.1 MMPL family transporter [Actinomycetes bacterium]
MYRKIAGWCADHRWVVVLGWLITLVGLNGVAGVIGPEFDTSFDIPASEAARGFEALDEHFPGAGTAFGGSIVFQADDVNDPVIVEAMTEVFETAAGLEQTSIVSPYSDFGRAQISRDGTIAFAQVNLEPEVDRNTAAEIGRVIRDEIPDIEGLRVEIGGEALAEFEPPESELIGIGFAIVILIVSFGSVLAMGLPISVALVGVGVGGIGALNLLTHVMGIPEFATSIGLMIGIGAGIDYALFIVTRYRELARQGVPQREAIVSAMDTAGRAVAFAGITVVLSLLGMLTIGLAFVSGLGIAAAVTVAFTMFASLTLLPALLAIVGSRVEITRWRGLISAGFVAVGVALIGLDLLAPGLVFVALGLLTLVVGLFVGSLKRNVPHRAEKPIRETAFYRWSRQIQGRPWVYAIGGTLLLVLLSVPILGLELGFSDEGNYSEETTTRQAYDLVADGFGPGFNGPFLLVAEVDGPEDVATVQQLAALVDADPGVASVGQPFPSNRENPPASDAFLIQIIATDSPQDTATFDTVKRLRSDVADAVEGTGVEANITGSVPANIDFSTYLSGRIPIFFGAVLSVSFLLLMAVFRSVLVPLKAVVMNVLSISASYGVVVLVFQEGWFGGITGIEPAPIEPFVPMMLFAIVFGLSMDYEVFLLSRIREEFDRTGDARLSVADGLSVTARVITAAAAIMAVVFGSFLLEDDRVVKLFGTGLALAVIIDATLVRMLLVPATMELLGEKNWWLPKWLDRILPTLNVEGSVDHN